MRATVCLALMFALASPAFADSVDGTDSPGSDATAAGASQALSSKSIVPAANAAHVDATPADTTPAETSKSHAQHRHPKWEEKFAKANTAHNGHLTLQEAESGYSTVAKHFQEIDVDGKGFVTLNDIRAWHAMRKAAHAHRQKPDDGLRPQHAFQRRPVDGPHPLNTSTSQTVQTQAQR